VEAKVVLEKYYLIVLPAQGAGHVDVRRSDDVLSFRVYDVLTQKETNLASASGKLKVGKRARATHIGMSFPHHNVAVDLSGIGSL
jgi:hypothetical protein